MNSLAIPVNGMGIHDDEYIIERCPSMNV